jgi:hypothetical protein
LFPLARENYVAGMKESALTNRSTPCGGVRDTLTMMRLVLLALLFAPTMAAADRVALTSTVTRAAVETPVVVVPAAAGKTVIDRFRSGAKAASGAPLVVIVRLPDANSPDVVAVSDAARDAGHIAIKLETRRFDGPLYRNVATTPYVEVALGTLPAGTYTIDIAETILHFSKQDAPQTATKPQPGFQSTITLTVQ